MTSDFNAPDFYQAFEMKEKQEMKKEISDLKKELKRREQIKKEEITLAQQLLLLHYLGLLKEIDLTTMNKSKLLSKILNRSMDNIRKNLPYIDSPKIAYSKIKNAENLQLVLNIFNELSMPQEADKVQVDINRIK